MHHLNSQPFNPLIKAMLVSLIHPPIPVSHGWTAVVSSDGDESKPFIISAQSPKEASKDHMECSLIPCETTNHPNTTPAYTTQNLPPQKPSILLWTVTGSPHPSRQGFPGPSREYGRGIV